MKNFGGKNVARWCGGIRIPLIVMFLAKIHLMVIRAYLWNHNSAEGTGITTRSGYVHDSSELKMVMLQQIFWWLEFPREGGGDSTTSR